MRVLLKVTVGLQVRHVEANGIKKAIRTARAEGVPEHAILAGTIWVLSPSKVADWAALVAKA